MFQSLDQVSTNILHPRSRADIEIRTHDNNREDNSIGENTITIQIMMCNRDDDKLRIASVS